jgi:hypothetical protein
MPVQKGKHLLQWIKIPFPALFERDLANSLHVSLIFNKCSAESGIPLFYDGFAGTAIFCYFYLPILWMRAKPN